MSRKAEKPPVEAARRAEVSSSRVPVMGTVIRRPVGPKVVFSRSRMSPLRPIAMTVAPMARATPTAALPNWPVAYFIIRVSSIDVCHAENQRIEQFQFLTPRFRPAFRRKAIVNSQGQ